MTTSHGGEERHEDLYYVHRLHCSQQALAEGLLYTPSNRLDHQLHRWLQMPLIP
jgi:hypothetical protein